MADSSRTHGPGLKFCVAQLQSGCATAVVNALVTIRTKFIKERGGIEKFRLHGGLRPLVALIQKPNVKIVDISLSIIANCCTESEARKEVRRLGGLPPIVLVLKSVTVESIQNRAARALANLAQDKQNSEILHKAGTVSHLKALLESGRDDECLQSAVRAVRNLADSPSHRAAMVSQGVVEPLAQLLKRGDRSGVVGASARALAELSRQCSTECAEVLSRVDAPSTLVALVCGGDAAVRADAMQTLSSLCSQAIVRPTLGSAGAIRCFVDEIRSARNSGGGGNSGGTSSGGTSSSTTDSTTNSSTTSNSSTTTSSTTTSHTTTTNSSTTTNSTTTNSTTNCTTNSTTNSSSNISNSSSCTSSSTNSNTCTTSSSTCTSSTTSSSNSKSSSSSSNSCTSTNSSKSRSINSCNTISNSGNSTPAGSAVLNVVRALCLCCREAVNRAKVVESGGIELLFSLLKDSHFKASHDRIILAFLSFFYEESALDVLLGYGLVPILVRRLEEWTLVSDKFQATAVVADIEDERYAASYDFPTEFNRKPDMEPNAESSSFLSMRSWLLTQGYIVSPGDISPRWCPDGSTGDTELEDLEAVPRCSSLVTLHSSVTDAEAVEEPGSPRVARRSGGDVDRACADAKRAKLDDDDEDDGRTATGAHAGRSSEVENSGGARQQTLPARRRKRLLTHPQDQRRSPQASSTRLHFRLLKFCQNARSEATSVKLKKEACLSSSSSSSSSSPALRASDLASGEANRSAATKRKENDARRHDLPTPRKAPAQGAATTTTTAVAAAAAAATAATDKNSIADGKATASGAAGPSGAASQPEQGHGSETERAVGPDFAILWLLSRFSMYVDPSFLVTTAVLRGLLNYVLGAARPSPRAARILLRLAANPNCLEAFVRTHGISTLHLRLCHGLCPDGEVEWARGDLSAGEGSAGGGVESLVQRTANLKLTTASNRELAWGMLRSLRIQAESGFGTGTLNHLLLSTRQGDKAACALALLYLCRNEPLRRRLLVDQCGLQLLVSHMLRSPDPSYVVRATGALLEFCSLEGKSGTPSSSPPPPHPPPGKLTSGKWRKPPGSEGGVASASSKPSGAPPRDGTSSCGYARCVADDAAADVKFVLDCGAKVSAQRKQLVSRSEVFGAMLQGHYSEAQQSCVAVRNASDAAFTLLMHHLHGCCPPACWALRAAYSPDCVTPPAGEGAAVESADPGPAGSGERRGKPGGSLAGSLLGELMALSNQFLLPDLKRELTAVVRSRCLHAESLPAVYAFAERHCFGELCRQCLEFLLTAPLTIAQRSRGFWELSQVQCNGSEMEATLHSVLLSFI
ncbi:armadillo repeat-containing protein 5 [Petromyzon marinus]|uniref:armadillo repeat-containing protein 5 n=1 Tax=Petromyzon marinus TaxID=7757 RepID=UPI003F70108C